MFKIESNQELEFLRRLNEDLKEVGKDEGDGKTNTTENGKFTAKMDVKKNEEYPENFRFALFENSDFQILIENADFDVELGNDLQKLPEKLVDQSNSHYIVSTMLGKREVEDFRDLKISMDSERLLTCENAGGNSVESEALSLEFFKRCWNAQLKETEMEIEYYPIGSKKTDYSIILTMKKRNEEKDMTLGVSVTRAFAYQGIYSKKGAKRLLKKKLYGIIESSNNVVEKSKWKKQILHIFTPSFKNERLLREAYKDLDEELKSNTVVVVTVTSRTLPFIYSENWEKCKNLC